MVSSYKKAQNCMFRSLTYFALFFTVTDLVSVTPPPPKHDNLCHYLGWGEYADPSSCDNYYACTNSRSILMPCPAGLQFRPLSDKKGVCDWSYNVECKDGVRPKLPTTLYPIPQ